MPQYAILIYAPAPGAPEDVPADELAAHIDFGARVEELGGRVVSGIALRSAAEARSVRGTTVIDGPFAEAKEVVGGVCVIEARDADHALEIARLNPATWRGGIEVRELVA